MDIQTLYFFKTIADHKSFTAASEVLHYAQSNLSTQIKKLEDEMGVTLFHRFKRGVSLTAKGQLFYEYADNILRLTKEASSAMSDMDIARGDLRIGSIEATALRDLPELIRYYHSNYPEVRLSMKTDMNDVFPGLVLGHKLDGAFIVGPYEHPELENHYFKSDELVLVGSIYDESCSAEEILYEKSLITFPEGSAFRQRMELLLASRSIAYSDRLTVFNSLGAMLANIVAGLGFGYLPKSVVSSYIERGLISEHYIDDPYSDLKIVFIHRKDRIMDAAFRYFVLAINEQSKKKDLL